MWQMLLWVRTLLYLRSYLILFCFNTKSHNFRPFLLKKRHANWVGGSLNVCKEECCIASLALCAHRTETDVMAAFGRQFLALAGLWPPRSAPPLRVL